MTKRIVGLAFAAAAVFAVPAAPASASHCINMGTTPVECTQEKVNQIVQSCIQGTQVVCLPSGS